MANFGDERLPARFWAKVELTANGCWVWTGAHDSHGYGQINWEGRTKQAHILSFDIFMGPPPEGLDRDHLCRQRDCVNPDHMEAVTRRVNLLRGEGPTATNAAKTSCIEGHAFTADNTYFRPNGRRYCRACARRRQLEWQREHPAYMRDSQRRYRARKKAAAG